MATTAQFDSRLHGIVDFIPVLSTKSMDYKSTGENEGLYIDEVHFTQLIEERSDDRMIKVCGGLVLISPSELSQLL